MSALPEDEVSALSLTAAAIRVLSIEAIERAKSGHPGMCLGMAEIGSVLYTRHLKFDAARPDWMDRDRMVVSNGHGSMLLYSLLHFAGYAPFGMEAIKNFRQLGSAATGHPECEFAGVEATTGPLGQGVAMAVGMALAEKMLNARFGGGLVDHFTYVLAGDGCLMEGVAQEAISLAGHWRLSKLIMLFDDNGISIDGPTAIATSDDLTMRFMASHWSVLDIDGHDLAAIDAAITVAKASDRPTFIRCRTVIGKGVADLQGTPTMHSGAVGERRIAAMRADLGWDLPPFTIPAEVYARFARASKDGATARVAWEGRVAAMPDEAKPRWRDHFAFDPAALDGLFANLMGALAAERPKEATRVSSQRVINALAKVMPSLLPGSADLTPACLTKAEGARAVTKDDAGGAYLYYGIREHCMCAVMNGLSLHGGFRPVGSTFLCFTDYARPAIRLAALMKVPGILVLSHDSITQGEDGPTHQAIEHAAIFRATPNTYLMRPADAVETAECWQAALGIADAPVLMVCTRSPVPAIRGAGAENLSAKGAYVIHGDARRRAITLLATGSEVALAIEAAQALEAGGIKACVVSMPCWELFERQDESYRSTVLGTAPRIAVEVFSPFGWTRYVDRESDVVGMTTFGTSAPCADVMRHFGFTVDKIVALAKSKLR